jgi:ribosomal protein S12 methylthiotransferase
MKKRATTSYRSCRSINSFYIENLGCAKNLVDAEEIIRALEDAGLSYTGDPEQADLILINSCGFIEPAKQESIETTLQLRTQYREKLIVLTGCLAQRYGQDLYKQIPELDGIVGNATPARIVEVMAELARGQRVYFFPERTPRKGRRGKLLTPAGSSYVKIAEGCNNFCSYCAIPLIRGSLVSRPVGEIVEEIAALHRQGIVEFNIIAQDVASYGLDRGKQELPLLLRELGRVEGDFWVRMLYMHPDNFPQEVLSVCKQDERILPYFDIPFQHASGRILTEMNRSGNREAYLDLIGTIRSRLPAAVIRSTFLVGYPGERRSDFEELCRFQEQARFDWLGVFAYSREEDTAAYRKRGRVAQAIMEPVIRRRKMRIEEKQIPLMQAGLDRFVDTRQPIFIEEKVEQEDLYLGRGYFQAPEVDSLTVVRAERLQPGTIVPCLIRRRNGIDLEAEPA